MKICILKSSNKGIYKTVCDLNIHTMDETEKKHKHELLCIMLTRYDILFTGYGVTAGTGQEWITASVKSGLRSTGLSGLFILFYVFQVVAMHNCLLEVIESI